MEFVPFHVRLPFLQARFDWYPSRGETPSNPLPVKTPGARRNSPRLTVYPPFFFFPQASCAFFSLCTDFCGSPQYKEPSLLRISCDVFCVPIAELLFPLRRPPTLVAPAFPARSAHVVNPSFGRTDPSQGLPSFGCGCVSGNVPSKACHQNVSL